MKIKSKDISVIIQGAIDKENTKKCLISIRKHLPQAEIILSTWQGEDCEFLDGLYDYIIFNEDPGAISMQTSNEGCYNINRHILSSKAGINKVNRKYIFRLRSDLSLKNSAFLNYFDKFKIRNEKYSIFKHKILTSSLFTIWAELGTKQEKGKKHLTPYHISDWWHFGLAEDINLLYSIDLVDITTFAQYFVEPKYELKWLNHRLWKFPPEQYLGVSLAQKKYPKLKFENCLDLENIDTAQSENFIIDNFITLDYAQSGILCEKDAYRKMGEKYWKIPPHVYFSMYSFRKYCEVYYKCNNIPHLFFPDVKKLFYLYKNWRKL